MKKAIIIVLRFVRINKELVRAMLRSNKRYLRIYMHSLKFIRPEVAIDSKIRTKAHIVDKSIHSLPFQRGRGVSNAIFLKSLLSTQNLPDSVKVRNWAENILNLYEKKQEQPDLEVYENLHYENYPSILEVLKTRVSVRNFKRLKPELTDLNKAVEVALTAPSSCHRQPAFFYHIRKDEQIKAARSCIAGSTGFTYDNIPVITVVSADIRSYSPRDGETYIVDTALAVENYVLGLRLLGIGSTIMNWAHANNAQITKLKQLCRIPAHEEIITTVAIGYPEKLPLKPSSTSAESRSIAVE
jgi:nitroreductase